jgi:hypothetical protein
MDPCARHGRWWLDVARRALDFYETAPWQVDALVDYVPELSQNLGPPARGIWRGAAIWCPCVGDGSIVRRLQERGIAGPFVTMDIDPARPADFHGDMTQRDNWQACVERFGRPAWVVDNVPFGVALAFAQHAVEFACLGVALMTRISFAEPTRDRGPWLRDQPIDLSIVLERYSFTGNGKSDSATTAWQVWRRCGGLTHRGVESAYGYRDSERHALSEAASA